MQWLLIDAATHEVVSGPHDEEPDEQDGTYSAIVMFGYPDKVDWVPAKAGFVRKPEPAILTRLAFRRLFTQAERIAILQSDDMVVQDFMELSALAVDISLADPDVIAGVAYLETIGLIGEGRAAVISASEAPV